MSHKGIVWPGEAKKYASSPVGPDGYKSFDEIVPPPNWMERFPNNYTADNVPNLREDEHFQNWMRTAGLPTFTKLYARNDKDAMRSGTYQVTIGLSAYPTTCFLPSSNSCFLPRFPRFTIQRHQILGDIDCLGDRREKPLPRLGLCRRCRCFCPSRCSWSCKALDQA